MRQVKNAKRITEDGNKDATYCRSTWRIVASSTELIVWAYLQGYSLPSLSFEWVEASKLQPGSSVEVHETFFSLCDSCSTLQRASVGDR